MSKSRTRHREHLRTAGTIYYNNSTFPDSTPYYAYRQTTVDVVQKTKRADGTTPPSDFEMYEITRKGGVINHYSRNYLSSKPSRIIAGCYARNVGGRDGHSIPSGGWESLEGSFSGNVAKLLATTNPFRYSVSVPVMVAELVESASLLRFIKDSIVGTLGSAYIVNQWGYQPMIRDIRSLVNITKAIEQRIREFNSLLEHGGLRRKVALGGGSRQGPNGTLTLWSTYAITFDGAFISSHRSKVWGSVRWVPNRSSPIDLTLLTQFNEAAKVVLDLRRPDASTIWEAIPWSWLVDYFLNVGTTLQALEDTDKVVPTDICIMRERWIQYETRCTNLVNGRGGAFFYEESFTNAEVTHHYKIRTVVNPSSLGDLLSFGIMTKAQATNLFALLLSFRGRAKIQ